MYNHELFHLDRSIGLFSVDEIARNLKDNGQWVNAVDERNDTPVHVAIKNREIARVHAMLSHFTRVNAVNDQGDTVLHLFIDNCMSSNNDVTSTMDSKLRGIRALISRFFDKKHRIIRGLVAKGADINLKNKRGETAAQLAAKHGYVDVLKIFASSKQRDFIVGDGENLLHLIYKNAKSKHKDTLTETRMARYLIKQGCNANAKDADGYSPLHYALQTRRLDTARKLAELTFDIHRWHDTKVISKHLLTATPVCNPSIIQFLIEHGRADVNVKDPITGMTPLHFASSRLFQQYEVMEVIMKSGAHVEARDRAGKLALDYAVKHKNVKALECLMEFGVDVIRTVSLRREEVMMHQWLLEIFVLPHLTKLKALGFEIDKTYEPYLVRNDWQIYRRMCLEEVKQLKLCVVDVDDGTSLYDLLHMKSKHCRYVHLLKLLRNNLKSSFPVYHDVIRMRIHEIERWLMIKPATQAWYNLTNVNLPYICVENILSHLNNCCLRTMINSSSRSEDQIVYDSVLLQAKWLEEII